MYLNLNIFYFEWDLFCHIVNGDKCGGSHCHYRIGPSYFLLFSVDWDPIHQIKLVYQVKPTYVTFGIKSKRKLGVGKEPGEERKVEKGIIPFVLLPEVAGEGDEQHCGKRSQSSAQSHPVLHPLARQRFLLGQGDASNTQLRLGPHIQQVLRGEHTRAHTHTHTHTRSMK